MKANLAAVALALSLSLSANAHDPALTSTGTAPGHDVHEKHRHEHHLASLTPDSERLTIHLPDLALTSQNGERRMLSSEVIGDHIVVIDFVYTSCTTVCPVVSAIMAQVQDRLAKQGATDVRLVSMTIDPLRDTPARLKEYSRRHGAGTQWTWLTGKPANINTVLKQLGTYTPNYEDHPSVLMVGDGRTGEWTRFYGFPDPDLVLARVAQLSADRARPLAAAAHHE